LLPVAETPEVGGVARIVARNSGNMAKAQQNGREEGVYIYIYIYIYIFIYIYIYICIYMCVDIHGL